MAELCTMTDEQKALADVDHDGSITVLDATVIQRYLAELIEKF